MGADAQTSLWAYQEVLGDSLALTESYKEIVEVLNKKYGFTAYEIARYCGYSDPNKVRPRMTELKKAGIIRTVGQRPDRITRKTSYMWDLTDKGRACMRVSIRACINQEATDTLS